LKRFVTNRLAITIVCSCLLAFPASRPAAAADDGKKDEEKALLQADHSLVQAVANGNKKAVDGLLDANFTWID
jgi:hypothetical protein